MSRSAAAVAAAGTCAWRRAAAHDVAVGATVTPSGMPLGLSGSRARPPRGRARGRARGGPGVPVEVGDLQQQVAPGHPAAAAHRARQRRCRRGRRTRPATTSRSTTGPRRPARGARSPTASRRAGRRRSRSTSASLMPLTSASESRMPYAEPSGRPGHRDGAARALVEDLRRRLVVGRDPLDAVDAVGGVDVEAEHRDAEVARVVEDQPLGVHARVVGEHAGEERRRVVGLEPRRLVGGQRERGGVRLAEAERRERAQHLPHLLDGRRGRSPRARAAG